MRLLVVALVLACLLTPAASAVGVRYENAPPECLPDCTGFAIIVETDGEPPTNPCRPGCRIGL